MKTVIEHFDDLLTDIQILQASGAKNIFIYLNERFEAELINCPRSVHHAIHENKILGVRYYVCDNGHPDYAVFHAEVG